MAYMGQLVGNCVFKLTPVKAGIQVQKDGGVHGEFAHEKEILGQEAVDLPFL